MNNSHMIVSLPSSRGWKKAERVIEDIAPTKMMPGTAVEGQHLCLDIDVEQVSNSRIQGDDSDQPFQDDNICSVCSENQARYTCPKCQAPYCSIECFRNHTDPVSSYEGSTNPYSCSEQFFKRKVTSLMQLESSEKEEKTRRALNRYHHDNSGHQDCEDTIAIHDDEIENLYKLQSQLEVLENENAELSQGELAKILHPSLKAMFERDLQTGQLQAEWVLNHWYPWWRREIVVNRKGIETDGSVFKDNNQNHSANSSVSKILDERLLRVPNFRGKSNDEVLTCNLIEIVYAICRTLCLYHGIENASQQAPVEAATTLISTSSVLGKDARFGTIYEALDHHYNNTSEQFTSSSSFLEDGRGTPKNKLGDWHFYVEDVASIISSPRMVGRALLEASDILKAAIKKLTLDHNGSVSKTNESSLNCKTNLKQIRCLRKKLQFYLSWATRHQAAKNLLLGGGPKDEILSWIDERKQMFSDFEYDEDGTKSAVVTRNLHTYHEDTIGAFNSHSRAKPIANKSYGSNPGTSISGCELQEPMLVEMQSRRKKIK